MGVEMIFRVIDKVTWADEIDVYIGTKVGDRVMAVEPLVFKEAPDGEALSNPSLRLTPAAARHLMDELWSAGVRPSSGAGSVGQIAATEKHLEDMRKLVFQSFDKPIKVEAEFK